MSDAKTTCHPDRIDEFLNGAISSGELSQLELHLSDCQTCKAILQDRTAEPQLWEDTMQFLSQQDTLETNETIAVDVVNLLDPTDDPNMMGRFGGYEISGVIGRGGMGVVLKGLDVSLDRFVAIKLLSPTYGSNSAARKRFAREAQAAAAVVHDNVIAIYGVSDWKGIPFLVMPYVKGESLQQRIERTAPMSIETTLEVSLQIARGLAAAHDQGLVHRDIKPANILMPESVTRVLITDFGLARAADDASLTYSGVIAGTPQYMSPEQATGEPVDTRTDLFSLGSVMYAMLCGHSPFRAETSYGTLTKVRDQTHRPISHLQPSTPSWLESIVDRLLEKSADDRFESASEVADHLEDCLAHVRQPATVVLPALKRRTCKKPNSSWRWIVASVATLAGLGVLGLGLLVYAVLPTQDQPAISRPTDPYSGEQWQVDDAELTRLETELQSLLNETSL